MTPLMRDIGEELSTSRGSGLTARRLRTGRPGAPLAESTKKRKRRNLGRILTERGLASRSHGIEAREELTAVAARGLIQVQGVQPQRARSAQHVPAHHGVEALTTHDTVADGEI